MKFVTKHCILLIILVFSIYSCKTREEQSNKLVFDNLEKETEDLIDAWYPRIIDTIDGGFFTNFSHDWTPGNRDSKMIVTQARGLWAASRAYQKYPSKPYLKTAAGQGFDFLVNHMWDQSGGGFLFNYPERSGPIQHKLIYGHTFGIYALAEYYKINPSPEVKESMMKAFQWMEDFAHDDVNGGYNNVILDDDLNLSIAENVDAFKRLGWGNPGWKDQNTSIHILEALTNLYEISKDDKVKVRLEEMLHLVRDVMVGNEGYLNLYFSADWHPILHRDSSKQYIEDNIGVDHISFGHNIETAFLLIDAAEALYGEVDNKTLVVAKKLTDHSLKFGFDDDHYGIYDKGFLYSNDDVLTVVDKEKVWWSQAEAVHALALMYKHYPENEEYKTAALSMWNYIQNNIIDHNNGGWYPSGLDNTPEAETGAKANPWKGVYHDGRALMNLGEL